MTDTKAPRSRHPEDLSTRARRDELSDQLGRDFDEELCLRSGDDALILRAARAALERPRSRRSRRLGFALGLAAALLVSTAAAMSLWSARPTTPMPKSVKILGAPGVAASAPSQRPAPTRGEPRAIETPAPSSSTPERRAATAPAPSARRSLNDPAPVTQTTEGSAPLQSASELFRAAGSARRAGDATRARALYAQLESQFPSSHEARVSRVSLGKLLLEVGRASEADRAFSSYLAEGDRVLEEEAWVGRAEALSRMGNAAEEIRVWQALLRAHPASVYRARAEQRLQALGAPTARTRDGS